MSEKAEKKKYGYVRVSTREQNEDRQMIAMAEMDVPEQNIFLDKQSGKDFNCPQYKRLLKRLKENDSILISGTNWIYLSWYRSWK